MRISPILFALTTAAIGFSTGCSGPKSLPRGNPPVVGLNQSVVINTEAADNRAPGNVIPQSMTPAVPPATANAIRVPVFFSTDRKITGAGDPYNYFGGSRDLQKGYHLGVVEVSIPMTHSIGEMESRAWYNFWTDRRDTSRYFVISRMTIMGDTSFYTRLKQVVQTSDDKDLFIFIHGFKNTFADAAQRTAQLAYDLGFKGAPILYSWASKGDVDGYDGDGENVRATVTPLKAFLSAVITRTHAKKINIIAHSMGSRALADALNEISLEKGVTFNEVILAAPDIDAEMFRRDIVPNILPKCKRITIYSSANDKALLVSEHLHNDIIRVGEAGDHLFLQKGIQTVDASNLRCPDFFDHSYLMESRALISDIAELFNYDAPPEKRNLLAMRSGAATWWAFKP
jgi:esterase/lipase superfamily enzyme